MGCVFFIITEMVELVFTKISSPLCVGPNILAHLVLCVYRKICYDMLVYLDLTFALLEIQV